MTFDQEYPDALSRFTTPDGFMKGSGRHDECANCDEPTTWFHRSIGLYFCSRDCRTQFEAKQRGATGLGGLEASRG